MNLILVVADTFRSDHLGAYGADWIKTPNLDAFAARSTAFHDHHAASFPTLPARADFFLGKWTFAYRGWEPIPATEHTLAARLDEAGFDTAGVVDTPFYLGSGFAYDRGFKYFTDLDTQRRGGAEAPNRPQLLPRTRRSELDYCAPRTFALAEQYLEQLHERPFFMLVDTWDPHEPWDPPAWYVRNYRPDYDGRVVSPPYGPWRDAGLTEEDVEIAHACYAGEITMVDRWFGRLLERLESLGIADDTAIVFTSDHGFYFGEHGYLGKMVIEHRTGEGRGVFWRRSPLYREVTQVPLIVHLPGAQPGVVTELTSAVDIMPTIVEMLLGTVPDDVQGSSLLGYVNGRGSTAREFVVTSPPLANPGAPIRVVDDVMRYVAEYLPATITTRDWTLLFSAADEPIELYDRAADPQQLNDVAADHTAIAEQLLFSYGALLRSSGASDEHLRPRFR